MATIAVVDGEPVLTAVAGGTTTITAEYQNLTATATVTVVSGFVLPFGVVQWGIGPMPGGSPEQVVVIDGDTGQLLKREFVPQGWFRTLNTDCIPGHNSEGPSWHISRPVIDSEGRFRSLGGIDDGAGHIANDVTACDAKTAQQSQLRPWP